MDFDHLMEIVRDEPVFETGFLLAGDVDPNHIRRQLTRWTNNGRLYQLRRGLYALAPGRPRSWDTPLGTFFFRHVHRKYFFGYKRIKPYGDQQAIVAEADKALLDLIYLTPGGDTEEYIHSLRLQNLEQLDLQSIERTAEKFKKPKLLRAAQNLNSVITRTMREQEE
jgi:predicted transcriptional regulator of viral defense system